MNEGKPQYHFSGSAVGAAAHFHKLDEHQGLNYMIPALAATALPGTGGLSRSRTENYLFEVQHPRRRPLLSVHRIESFARGQEVRDGVYETEVQSDIEYLGIVEKLYIGSIQFHFLSTRDLREPEIRISTKGARIESMWLGKVRVKVELDNEPLCFCGSHEQLAKFYRDQPASYRQEHHARFGVEPDARELPAGRGYHRCTLVRSVELVGEEADKQGMHVSGNTITWEGFGKIFLGEVLVKGEERMLNMVRLAMGSDAGGTGSSGSGQSNGALGN